MRGRMVKNEQRVRRLEQLDGRWRITAVAGREIAKLVTEPRRYGNSGDHKGQYMHERVTVIVLLPPCL
jgi:hypothetical protein